MSTPDRQSQALSLRQLTRANLGEIRIMNSIILCLFLTYGTIYALKSPRSPISCRSRLHATAVDISGEVTHFLKEVAMTSAPKRLDTLLSILDADQNEELVSPTHREGMCPFLIPLSRNKEGQYLCYIRWPTQKEDMDLQLVRTTNVGIILEAMGTDQYCHRKIVEGDYFGEDSSVEMIELLNKDGQMYEEGDYMGFLKSGKFDTISEEGKRLVLDRYLLTKVGAFPDCFERLANHFLKTGSDVSALVTCERAVSVFYGWGHPLTFHAKMLMGIPERELEAKDCARAAMGLPAWTLARNETELDEIVKIAGYEGGKKFLGEMHAYRAKDPRKDDIGEGLDPKQVTLDQVAHLMDAVVLGGIEGGWEASKQQIADMYVEGGYPQLSRFILA